MNFVNNRLGLFLINYYIFFIFFYINMYLGNHPILTKVGFWCNRTTKLYWLLLWFGIPLYVLAFALVRISFVYIWLDLLGIIFVFWSLVFGVIFNEIFAFQKK